MGYKSRPHLSRGAEGTAHQVAQREAALAKRKKKTKKVRGRFEKEKEINHWLHGGERREEVEEELKSEDPMDSGDDAGSSEDEGDKGAAMTFMERRAPVAAPIGSRHGMEMHDDAPKSRKHAVGEDVTRKR